MDVTFLDKRELETRKGGEGKEQGEKPERQRAHGWVDWTSGLNTKPCLVSEGRRWKGKLFVFNFCRFMLDCGSLEEKPARVSFFVVCSWKIKCRLHVKPVFALSFLPCCSLPAPLSSKCISCLSPASDSRVTLTSASMTWNTFWLTYAKTTMVLAPLLDS